MFSWRKLRNWLRRHKAAAIHVAPAQWQRVEACLPFLDRLGQADRQRLRGMALELLVDKQMSAAQGLQLHTEMQLSIALQACLPVLKLGLDWYHGWTGIIVYPGDFIVPRCEIDETGVVHEFDDAVLGEAWENGPVLLAWFENTEDDLLADHNADHNVVIHEFAHKLDMKNGVADGFPPLHGSMTAEAWRDAFIPAYEDFCRRVEQAEHTELDPYAATAPAEFFAVMSEAFFCLPQCLHDEYPAVYTQLSLFYRQQPLLLPPGPTEAPESRSALAHPRETSV